MNRPWATRGQSDNNVVLPVEWSELVASRLCFWRQGNVNSEPLQRLSNERPLYSAGARIDLPYERSSVFEGMEMTS
jgi:hypothetical protein